MAKGWSCPKCANMTYDEDSIAVTGTGLSKIFDVQNRKFTTVTCTRCSYTEFYKIEPSKLGNVFDFFTG